MAKKKPPGDASIGKFDILATYVYARALIDGLRDDEAKQRGMFAATMGAQANVYARALIDGLKDDEAKQRGMFAPTMGVQTKLGTRKQHHEDFQAQKEAAEKKKKTTISAESFDRRVAHKFGAFFGDVFLPTLKKLVEAGLSYDQVKQLVRIPTTFGAKIRGEQFRERTSAYLEKRPVK